MNDSVTLMMGFGGLVPAGKTLKIEQCAGPQFVGRVARECALSVHRPCAEHFYITSILVAGIEQLAGEEGIPATLFQSPSPEELEAFFARPEAEEKAPIPSSMPSFEFVFAEGDTIAITAQNNGVEEKRFTAALAIEVRPWEK